ncbi:serine hydrolase domain-containing protein [Streptomyces sp. NPDC091212]|uniref:serine hydrolase domain-containing protein n=1 Tax=Streptomyces sp. NPDC091212 TaxID=3155191 RepID=UPI00342633F7
MHGLEGLEGLEEFCTGVLQRHGCASVSVAVAERDEVMLAEAYGLADRAAGRAATADTVYGLASITKPLTATAVCAAADEGELDLDAPLPGEYGGATPPSIRQTLQHRGGFGAHYDWRYGDGDGDDDSAPDPAIPTSWYAGRLYREPGTGFEYANLGYRALGSLLGDLDEQIGARIARPLGLTSLRVGHTHPGPGPTAVRYTADGRAYPVCRSGHPAAGAAWATASDVALFAQNCARLLTPRTAAAVYDAVPVGPAQGYGLGWSVSSGAGPLLYSHSGGMGGVGNMVVRIPEHDRAVAVLTNSTDKTARDAILRHVLARVAPGFDPAGLSAIPATGRAATLPEGGWTGRITTREGDLPLTVDVLADRRIEVRLDDAGTATVPFEASADWDLRALLPLQIPTADARIDSPLLVLELALRQDRLTGAARAMKSGEGTGWLGNYLSHPCELTRN